MNFLKSTARDLRIINRQLLLQLIYFHAPTTRFELSKLSGLSPATVTNVVTMFLNEGIVTELGAQESLGGRPRIKLALSAEFGYFIGVDVGETYLHIELLDLKLQKVNQTRRTLLRPKPPVAVSRRKIIGIQLSIVYRLFTSRWVAFIMKLTNEGD